MPSRARAAGPSGYFIPGTGEVGEGGTVSPEREDVNGREKDEGEVSEKDSPAGRYHPIRSN